MTFTTHAAMNSAQRVADKARRLKTLKMREATMLQRYGTRYINGYNSVSQIPMHVTPWWKDEFGNMTRQIWAK